MRVKISFTNPSNRAAQNVLLAIPEHLKYIIDLEVFLIDKLKLGKYLEQTKKGTLVKINGYILPKTEKIKELVSEDDLISLEFTDSKRKAEKNIENDIDDIVTSDINQNEESRDRNFLKMLEEVTLLRRLYHKMKNNEPVIDNEIKKSSLQALPIVSKKIVEHQSDSEKEEEKIIINKKAPTNARKSKVIEYNSSDMDSSEEEVPVVKKKETQEKVKEKEKEKSKEKETIKPKTKTKTQITTEKSSEDEPQIIEKKIDTSNIGLKILSPEEEYLIKKEHWKSLPIYQWTSKKKPEKNNDQPQMKKNKNYNKTFERTEEPNQNQEPKFINFQRQQFKAESKNKIEVNKKFTEETDSLKIPKNYVLVPIKLINDLWKNQSKIFLKPQDVVKYKCEILSEKMQPEISEFRYGIITDIKKNQINIDRSKFLRTNEEEEDQTESVDDLFLHNIHEILLSEDSLDEERKKTIQTFMDNAAKFINEQKELIEKKKQLQEKLKQMAEKNEQETEGLNPDKLKKQMIGKQINYYFSDKNYFRDEFMQGHCSKNPDQYMEVKLLLNFPKIRQMTGELSTIMESIEYVRNLTDIEINFELNPEMTLIRKKVSKKEEEPKGA